MLQVSHRESSIAGFTLIELLVVISIISLLASIVLASLNSARAKARDARRIADVNQIKLALGFYYDANNAYPGVTYTSGQSLAGWEVSFYSDFMEYLSPAYLAKTPLDPINSGPPVSDGNPYGAMFNTRPDGTFFYMYYGNYGSGATYGCPWPGSFGVVGFRALETGGASKLPQAKCGPMPCAGGGTSNVCRNWANEFDYSLFLVN